MTDAEAFLTACPKGAQSLFRVVHDQLVKLGCTAYPSTIYMGYEQAGCIVAAVYPRQASLEIALALPEDHVSPLLRDATHLTWRTMPVAVEVASVSDLASVMSLLEEAHGRVVRGYHPVEVPIERFAERTRQLRQRYSSAPRRSGSKA